jgi:hypothetical protein
VILSQIRDYLRERGQASLRELALRFDTDPDALRGMLAHWVRKGRVSRQTVGTSCGGCTQCDPAAMEIYLWGEAAPKGTDVLCGSSTR